MRGRGSIECANALRLRSARITGALRLGETQYEPKTRIEGSLDLRAARVSVFIDSEKAWPPAAIARTSVPTEGNESHPGRPGEALPCHIHLAGFSYKYFGGRSPLDANVRCRWLLRQSYGDSLEPQPFEQLIKVFQAMGYVENATRIAIFKEGFQESKINLAATWIRICPEANQDRSQFLIHMAMVEANRRRDFWIWVPFASSVIRSNYLLVGLWRDLLKPI